MPKVTKEHRTARKRQILDAAVACFSRKGLYKSSMQEICKASSLSPGAVYSYFKSKEEIITAIAKENRQRNMTLIDEKKETKNTLPALHDMADEFFCRFNSPGWSDCMRLDIELWAESLRNAKVNKTLRHDMAEHRRAFAEIIRKAQERGEMDKEVTSEAVASVMISMFIGMTVQKGIDPKIDIENYITVLKEMMAGLFNTGDKG